MALRGRDLWNSCCYHSTAYLLTLFFFPVGLVNSQIVLKGIESEGCVVVAAGNARILNRLHTPVWSKGEIFNKGTWVGNVENLQVTIHFSDMFLRL